MNTQTAQAIAGKSTPVSNGEAQRLANLKAHAKGETSAPVALETQREENAQLTLASDALQTAFTAYYSDAFNLSESKKALEGAEEQARGKRETVLIALAAFSAENALTAKQVDAAKLRAVELWVKAGNGDRTEKSVSQFALECALAMHPLAREHVASDFDAATIAFEAERDAYNDAVEARKADKEIVLPPKPLAKAFGRKYHAVASSKGTLAARIGKPASGKKPAEAPIVFEDLHELAETHETRERRNPQRAERLITSVLATMRAVYEEFPASQLDDAILFVEQVCSADVLEAARAKLANKARIDTVAQRAAKLRGQAQTPAQPKAPVPARQVLAAQIDVDADESTDADTDADAEAASAEALLGMMRRNARRS